MILSDHVECAATAIGEARQTLAVIRQNLAWAIAYNAIAIPAAAFGFVTPLFAALGMSLSSLVVVANALRLTRRCRECHRHQCRGCCIHGAVIGTKRGDAMEILMLLIPMSVVLVLLIGAVFWWSVHSGQFDDLEGPAHRILADDDGAAPPDASSAAASLTEVKTLLCTAT